MSLQEERCAGVALAPVIFGVWMDFSGSILANWWRRRSPVGTRGDSKGVMK